MPDPGRLYTPAEAGAVSGLRLKAVHNAIDKHIVEPAGKAHLAAFGKVNRVGPRFLTGEDLVRLRVWRGVGGTLSAERRQRLFVAIAAQPSAKTVQADELLIVDVGKARKQVDRGVRDLEAAEAIVAKDKGTLGGEPGVRRHAHPCLRESRVDLDHSRRLSDPDTMPNSTRFRHTAVDNDSRCRVYRRKLVPKWIYLKWPSCGSSTDLSRRRRGLPSKRRVGCSKR